MTKPQPHPKNFHLRNFNRVVWPQPDKILDPASGRTLLIDAILNWDQKKVEDLLASGAHPGRADAEGKTPLHYAARSGQFETVSLLIAYKALVNPRDKNLATPLFEALRSQNPLETIDLLLKMGANANIADDRGRLPLHDAAEKLGGDVIHRLAQDTADLTHADKAGMTALHYACRNNTLAAVRALVNEGAPVLQANAEGDTPLHIAATAPGNIGDVAEYLLTTEAAQLVNTPGQAGRTPLHIALSTQKKSLAEKMLKLGADPNMPDNAGYTPLMAASQQWGVQEDLIRLLIENGADINSHQPAAGTPLIQAIEMYNAPVLRLLLAYNADPDAADRLGNFPLLAAVTRGNGECMDILLKAGANPDSTNQNKQSSLYLACSYNMVNEVAVLLAHKADPNLADEQGRTALHVVMGGGAYTNPDIVRSLLKAGADPLKKDNSGLCPYDLMHDHGNLEILEMLKKNLKEKGVTYTPDPNRKPPQPPSPPGWGGRRFR